jgi:hypothetical protein
LGVDPRSLADDSIFWVHAALTCMEVENKLQEEESKKARKK